LVAEPIICTTKDSPRLFWAKDVQKQRKLIQKRQLLEKVCERHLCGKSQLNSSQNAKCRVIIMYLHPWQTAQDGHHCQIQQG
jgi:hypothetical protein